MSENDPKPLMNLLDQVQTFFMNSLVGGIGRLADKPEAWAFVGMRTETAFAQLQKARGYFPEGASPRFLDCGSGLGFILALAKELGFEVAGVEWSAKYADLARRLFPGTTTVQGDVLEYPSYGEFDVIYYYGPFAEDELQAKFEEKIEADAKVGAVIVCNRKISGAWRETNRFELLSDDDFMGVFLRKLPAP